MGTGADGHRYFEGMAVAHVLGGLDESDGRVFRSHLLECSDCRAHVGELRALAHELQDVERDERRVRAAKSIETKRREGGEDERDDQPPTLTTTPRVYRLLAVVAVLLVAGLAVWNFALRNELAQERAIAENVTDASQLLEFGEQVSPALLSTGPGVDARLARDEERAVLLISGVPDGEPHAIYQLSGTGGVLDSHAVQPRREKIFLLVRLREGATQLVVTQPGQGVPADPKGARVLTATLDGGE